MTGYQSSATQKLIKGLASSPMDIEKIHAAIDEGADVNTKIQWKAGFRASHSFELPLLARAAIVSEEQQDRSNNAVFLLMNSGANIDSATMALSKVHCSGSVEDFTKERIEKASGRILDVKDVLGIEGTPTHGGYPESWARLLERSDKACIRNTAPSFSTYQI